MDNISRKAISEAIKQDRDMEFLGTIRASNLALNYYFHQLVLCIAKMLFIDRFLNWLVRVMDADGK